MVRQVFDAFQDAVPNNQYEEAALTQAPLDRIDGCWLIQIGTVPNDVPETQVGTPGRLPRRLLQILEVPPADRSCGSSAALNARHPSEVTVFRRATLVHPHFRCGAVVWALIRMVARGQRDADLEPVDAVGPGRPARR